MSSIPEPVLAQTVAVLARRMDRRHPRLFTALSRLDRAVVEIRPDDLPHRFALSVGKPWPDLSLIGDNNNGKFDARISGPLGVLLDMLEARTDGDTLFFDRGITISGNTSVIVALRNTLDREEICLIDDVMSFCGPLAKPATVALGILNRLMKNIGESQNDGG